MSSPTNIDFDDLLPLPKPDAFNVEWQATAPIPDPNSPGNLIRELSGCYRTPQVGGVLVLTDDYDLGGPDSGWTFIANSASSITVKLPAVVPVLPSPQGLWRIKVKNFGSADWSIDPNGAMLDGSSAIVVVPQNSGFDIETDGTDYWTYGNFGVVTGAGATATASLFSDNETPSGTIDAVNTAFTLSQTPNPAGSLELYLDGQFMTAGTDYTLSGNAITMLIAPHTGASLLAFYRYGSGTASNFVDDETPSGTINGSNTAFTVANPPNPASSLAVFLDGMLMRVAADYTLAGSTITFVVAPVSGAVLRVFYRFVSATAFNFAGDEAPAGTIDSANTTFTLAHSPSPTASLRLYLDGILLRQGTDYTLSGATITTTFAPSTGESLYAFYRY